MCEHPGRQVQVLVHGDDFVTAADMAGLQWMKMILDEHLETYAPSTAVRSVDEARDCLFESDYPMEK